MRIMFPASKHGCCGEGVVDDVNESWQEGETAEEEEEETLEQGANGEPCCYCEVIAKDLIKCQP
jgi:hypothetical protein